MNSGYKELESKTITLTNLCGLYETAYFLKYIASLLLSIPKRHEHPGLRKLMSPLRQLFYAANLNLHSMEAGTATDLSEDKWEIIADLLHEIEIQYSNNIGFYQKDGEPLDYDKIKVVLPTFLTYFCNGPLVIPGTGNGKD